MTAAALASAVPSLVFAVSSPEVGLAIGLTIAWVGVIVALPILLLFGLPFAILHLSITSPRWWSSLLIGGGISLATWAILFAQHAEGPLVLNMAIGASYGACAGLAAWWVWMATGGGSFYTLRHG